MKTIKIALLGYGDAGRAFARLLMEKKNKAIEECFDTEVLITSISTKTKGAITDPAGIDIEKENESIDKTGKFSKYTDMSALEIAAEADYDILFELTPLDIFSGRPAIDHIETALIRGKHVVSANKGPIAWDHKRLTELAIDKGCKFFYETTVMDGTPVFNLMDYTMRMCKVTGIKGVLNSTTNFILEEMSKGIEYGDIIAEGKKRGFVETDPSLDVEGWDSAAKLTALMNVLMDAGINPNDIDRKGIEDITPDMIRQASENDKVIRLMCYTENKGGVLTGHVKPMEIDRTELYATVTGTTSVVSITTDLMGTVTVVEHDPEIEQTAYGIFSDLLRVLVSQ